MHLAVLSTPLHVAEGEPVGLPQETRSPIGEGIEHRWRALRKTIELSTGPVDIGSMEEPLQPVVRAIERAPDQRRDMRRAQEAVLRNVPDDLDIVVGETEGGRLRTTKPRPTHLPDSGDFHMPRL